jgi:hypothetical protein
MVKEAQEFKVGEIVQVVNLLQTDIIPQKLLVRATSRQLGKVGYILESTFTSMGKWYIIQYYTDGEPHLLIAHPLELKRRDDILRMLVENRNRREAKIRTPDWDAIEDWLNGR